MADHHRPNRVLPLIIASQFGGTALWFAVNAVAPDLRGSFDLPAGAVARLVSVVQLGFITGTLFFAALTLADRMSARLLFCVSSLLGAATNAAVLVAHDYYTLLALRFSTGFFLAGIYPVGMKIAASWFEKGLGAAFGYLVGALVLGTAFPHLVRAAGAGLDWQVVIIVVSSVAATGGVLMVLLVPEGPYLRQRAPFRLGNTLRVFGSADFRAAAFGYFGHMWELYAFWTFVPVAVASYAKATGTSLSISAWSFAIIGAGSVGCIVGGVLTTRFGSARVAMVQLACSCAMCVLSPLLFSAPVWLFLPALLVWGVTVVGDSSQFSTLNAQNAPTELVGTALTVVTSIGFAITIPSIQLLGELRSHVDVRWIFLALAPGPVLGLIAMRRLIRRPV